MSPQKSRRHFIIPEVIQTSAMDCGPASLKALLGGFDVCASYGRLREVCQTDVDGTSIDTLEEISVQLGLEARQVMTPIDHLLLPESDNLPAIVVVRLAGDVNHFLVVWRRHGRWLQIMDPAIGRRWVDTREFLSSIYQHAQSIPLETWLEWARGECFLGGLDRRMRTLGIRRDDRESLTCDALATRDWQRLAALDAGVRMAESLRTGGALPRKVAAALVGSLTQNSAGIPARYWSVAADPSSPDALQFKGAVLVQASGRRDAAVGLSAALERVISEHPTSPYRHLWTAVTTNGVWRPALVLSALAAAGAGTVAEALVLRGLFDVARHFQLTGQRVAVMAAVVGLLLLIAAFDWAAASGLLQLGRAVENRLRLQFLRKIPLLNDRFFQSRLVSDMAERAHALQRLRTLPELAGQLSRSLFAMIFTVAGLAWFFPHSLGWAVAAAVAAAGVPLLAQPSLAERDLRFREHGGSLSRFYLDALLGLTAIQAHAGERALRSAQAVRLRDWMSAGIRLQQTVVRLEAVQLTLSMALTFVLVWRQLQQAPNPAGLLLLVYWSLAVPAIGSEIAALLWQFPALRNTTLRALEPLGAPVEERARSEPSPEAAGVRVDLDQVTVTAGGHTILHEVSLHLMPGEHIAVVGPSGAGKSSLVGLLLGWHHARAGSVLVNGEPLTAESLDQLRRMTAWIDPQVHLWNDTLYQNLLYGLPAEDEPRVPRAVSDAGLKPVLEKLSQGLQTELGDGGGLLSGGEGQRVRMARAMTRDGARLVILDEPARSLERAARRQFIERARERWSDATLIYITHDVGDIAGFERVVAVENARIAQDGRPEELLSDPAGCYRRLYDAERVVSDELWSWFAWRRLRMEQGRLREEPPLVSRETEGTYVGRPDVFGVARQPRG